MYVRPNFPTKKALREAVKRGERVEVFSPDPFPAPTDGYAAIEGPHYPKPHSWYANVAIKNGIVVKVVG